MDRVRVALPSSRTPRTVTFELVEPPPGIAVKNVSCRGDAAEITVSCDAAHVKPGTRGNLIFQAFGQATGGTNGKSGQRPQRFSLGFVAAVPFEVAENPSSSL